MAAYNRRIQTHDYITKKWTNDLIYIQGKFHPDKIRGVWIGFIAREILMQKFGYVQVQRPSMPIIPGNKHDFVCDGLKICIKTTSSAHPKNWIFTTRMNKSADDFLCIAFNDYTNCIPHHAWIIPTKILAQQKSLWISKEFSSNWEMFEQPLENVVNSFLEVKDSIFSKIPELQI